MKVLSEKYLWWIIIALCIVFFPLGIYLLSKKIFVEKKVGKIIGFFLSILAAVFFYFAFVQVELISGVAINEVETALVIRFILAFVSGSLLGKASLNFKMEITHSQEEFGNDSLE